MIFRKDKPKFQVWNLEAYKWKEFKEQQPLTIINVLWIEKSNHGTVEGSKEDEYKEKLEEFNDAKGQW